MFGFKSIYNCGIKLDESEELALLLTFKIMGKVFPRFQVLYLLSVSCLVMETPQTLLRITAGNLKCLTMTSFCSVLKRKTKMTIIAIEFLKVVQKTESLIQLSLVFHRCPTAIVTKLRGRN
uniref:Uncharacterized protein n=1 Tax=Micrurus spixii TaxID=129469 RepID=A0A2D4NK23_9SAUR